MNVIIFNLPYCNTPQDMGYSNSILILKILLNKVFRGRVIMMVIN